MPSNSDLETLNKDLRADVARLEVEVATLESEREDARGELVTYMRRILASDEGYMGNPPASLESRTSVAKEACPSLFPKEKT